MNAGSVNYIVLKEYESPYPDPIHFQEGEIIEVGETYEDDPDWVDWVWCCGEHHNDAWVPKQFIYFQNGQWVMKRNYNAMELILEIGESVNVLEIVNGFGMAEKSDGSRGWVPMNHLQKIGGDW
jgi:hypothetical protein